MRTPTAHWARAKFLISEPLGKNGTFATGSDEHKQIARKIAEECIVLTKNNGMLPLKKGKKVAFFGIAQYDYVKGGTGAGNVWCGFKGIMDGMDEQAAEGNAEYYRPLAAFYKKDYEKQTAIADQIPKPRLANDPNFDLFGGAVNNIHGEIMGHYVEHLPSQKLVDGAKQFTDTAFIVLNRCSGEFYDRSPVKGDYYLSDTEQALIALVKKNFKHIGIIFNSGAMIEAEWMRDKAFESVLFIYTPGMMGGLAVADILCGKVNPSGKLTDTVAGDYKDYPSSDGFQESQYYVNYTDDIFVGYRYFETIPGAAKKVVFPFGFGLSYTTFSVSTLSAEEKNGKITLTALVKNTGKVAGKEVVQVYYGAPQGLLGKAAKSLIAFKKTKLLAPGKEEKLTLSFKVNDMASYDDTGKLQKSAWILEKGDYPIYLGTSVRDVETVFTYTVKEKFRLVKQMTEVVPACALPKKLKADGTYEELPMRACEQEHYDFRLASAKKAPAGNWKLDDVLEGKITLDQFVTTLSQDQLIKLTFGIPSMGICQTGGFGGIPAKGIPPIMTSDAPCGMRNNSSCGVEATCFPAAATVACSFNPELARLVGETVARELREYNLYAWLGPSLNIHRAPLCGRNFEYYSEDPLLSGIMAGYASIGCQSMGVSACPKHFCCNNKEECRKDSDSRLTERAMREIYLKGFAICIKLSKPKTVMSSYNLVNGHRVSESYQLLTQVLRKEMGFDGFVYTDWNGHGLHLREVRAGNDLKMLKGDPDGLKSALREGYIGVGELQAAAKNILKVILWYEGFEA